jgi:N-acetylglucosamine-6-phosphate deacetylase
MSLLVRKVRALDVDGTRDNSWILADSGVIQAVGTGESWRQRPLSDDDAEVLDAGGRLLTPGFIDLHAHGAGGHRFEEGGAALEAALAVHRRRGTTRSVISLASDHLDALEVALADVANLANRDELVLGSHLEGPYLSPRRRGAHDPAALREPHAAEIERLVDVARGTLRQLTIAPELPGALAAIRQLAVHGVVVAVGHTEATYEQTRDAIDAGATLLTHAYNAMPNIGHRAPGPVVAAIDDDRAYLEIINDGHHVDPRVVALTFRCAPGRVAMVSDAMAATGVRDGAYTLGRREVTVTAGVARMTGTTTLAGSTVTLDETVRRAIAAGIDPVNAVAAVTSVPAAVLGYEDRLGRLQAGYAADLVVLDADWRVVRVYAAGRNVSS